MLNAPLNLWEQPCILYLFKLFLFSLNCQQIIFYMSILITKWILPEWSQLSYYVQVLILNSPLFPSTDINCTHISLGICWGLKLRCIYYFFRYTIMKLQAHSSLFFSKIFFVHLVEATDYERPMKPFFCKSPEILGLNRQIG